MSTALELGPRRCREVTEEAQARQPTVGVDVQAHVGDGLLARCDPQDTEALVGKAHVSRMVMGGREMDGWLSVDAEGVRTKRQLEPWVKRALAYAGSLPPK